jgi:Uma2 family endonuclease
MSSAVMEQVAAPPRTTTAELLARPDDGVERWLVDGVIEEVGMTMRYKRHTRTETRVARFLNVWSDSQPARRGSVHSGEVGVILREDPELSVSIDVVYLNSQQTDHNDAVDEDETTILVAPITLAVEILSPSDTIENIQRKLDWFAECGVQVAWVLNPYQRTVAIHRPGVPPVTLN